MELFFKTLYCGELIDCHIASYNSMVYLICQDGLPKHIGHYKPEHLTKNHPDLVTIFRYSGKKIKPMDEKIYEGHILKNLLTEKKYYIFWDYTKQALRVKVLESRSIYNLDVLDDKPFEIVGHIALENGHETIH